MHNTPQFWPVRVRALLTNGPTNELLEGREKVVEGTDRQGRKGEREQRAGEEMGSRYSGRWKDRWNMHERTAGGRTDRTKVGRYGDERNRFENPRWSGGPKALKQGDMVLEGFPIQFQGYWVCNLQTQPINEYVQDKTRRN